MLISKSVTIKKATYKSSGSIVIKGNNITVDFNGAELSGITDPLQPDKFKGTAIVIEGGKNIILKNATIKGFKVAVTAKNTRGLQIIDCDFSYNFRQHLNSTRQREDLTDWQSYHKNEDDEWLRFGAGIYLKNCDSAIIKGNTITNGQCGLMMTNSNAAQVYNNNFSFNSGIGIGLYRSSNNIIINNKVDWNVRGFSFGVYYRGQDSAGMLVYEQSNNNIFAYNSVTHSGDGFFLWGGQTTIETGRGGCNDNLVYNNDFSYAPTNGIEITFSRNRIIKNKVYDCWHGIWGGFSYNTVIKGNDFANNLAGISIEHGQENIIENNSFNKDLIGIELWATPNRKGEPGYMKSRDTRSRDYKLTNNKFTGVKNVYDIKRSENILINDPGPSGYEYANINEDSIRVSSLLPGGIQLNAMLPVDHPQGKKYIMMTEWGPYNFEYPILWKSADSLGKTSFDIMGKEGNWELKTIKGAKVIDGQNKGRVPGNLVVEKTVDSNDIYIELAYTGETFISPFGKKYDAGTPYIFSFKEFKPDAHWKIKWFGFDSTSDPIKNSAAFQKILKTAVPVKTADTNDLHFGWWSGLGKGSLTSHIATVAEGVITVPANNYRLGISAADLVRVWVDNKLVIDAWKMDKKFDSDYHQDVNLKLGGTHAIRIEHAQYGGYGMLSFSLN